MIIIKLLQTYPPLQRVKTPMIAISRNTRGKNIISYLLCNPSSSLKHKPCRGRRSGWQRALLTRCSQSETKEQRFSWSIRTSWQKTKQLISLDDRLVCTSPQQFMMTASQQYRCHVMAVTLLPCEILPDQTPPMATSAEGELFCKMYCATHLSMVFILNKGSFNGL